MFRTAHQDTSEDLTRPLSLDEPELIHTALLGLVYLILLAFLTRLLRNSSNSSNTPSDDHDSGSFCLMPLYDPDPSVDDGGSHPLQSEHHRSYGQFRTLDKMTTNSVEEGKSKHSTMPITRNDVMGIEDEQGTSFAIRASPAPFSLSTTYVPLTPQRHQSILSARTPTHPSTPKFPLRLSVSLPDA